MDRCVEFTYTQPGIYPDKALSLMKSISTYYVDKKDISIGDVYKYLKEVKDSSRYESQSTSALNVEFNTGIKLKDIVGNESIKKEAKTIVDQIKTGRMGTKGFTISAQDGFPGGGRKYTAKAIAGETKIPFIQINAYDFGTKDVSIFDDSILSPEATIKKLFNLAKAQAEANPHKAAMIYIENFECFASDEYASEYDQKAFSQLLKEMDNLSKSKKSNIIVIGSLTEPDSMGEAAMKSLKFVDNIEVESPSRNAKARKEILSYLIKKDKIKVAGETEKEKSDIIQDFAETTEGFPFIQLKQLVEKTQNIARERGHKTVGKSDFTEAYLQVTTGRASSKPASEHNKTIITSHECGHATGLKVMYNLAQKQNIPWYLPSKVNFITLDPRGYYGGAMYPKDSGNEQYNFETLFSDIVCTYGGHSSEKNFYNMDGSWGISGDLEIATNEAKMGVAQMGLGPSTGKISVSSSPFEQSPSLFLQRQMDKDIHLFLNNALVVSDKIIKTYAGFIEEFTQRHKDKVGTGECIIQGEEFDKHLTDWINRQSPETKEKLDNLDQEILEIIKKTKKGEEVKNEPVTNEPKN